MRKKQGTGSTGEPSANDSAESKVKVGRRNFLKSATLGGALMAAPLASANAAPSAANDLRLKSKTARNSTSVHPLSTTEQECAVPPPNMGGPQMTCGSDYMVDALRHVGIEHIIAIPGSTFKALHESVINYGMQTSPKLDHLTVTHEEASIAFCHGYFKVSGKPMAAMVHATVGLQHASMAIYNAFCDRVPMIVLPAAHLDATKRSTPTDWIHTVNDGPSLTREFTKWDDTPGSLAHFGESVVRGYRFAMTPPYGPIVIACDQELQEMDLPGGKAPPLPAFSPPTVAQGDSNAVREAARMLAAANNPVIIADRAARTPAGLKLMVELAEALQCAVVDVGGRMNFPWRHPLNMTSAVDFISSDVDLVLGLELTDWWFAMRDYPATAKRINISCAELYMKSTYQEFERYTPVDLSIGADAEATLPALIAAVKTAIGTNRRSALQSRGGKLGDIHKRALQRSREATAVGWDSTPISTSRLCAELYEVIRNEDWGLTSGAIPLGNRPAQLWEGNKYYSCIGGSGGSGIGYTVTSAMGAALAHKEQGSIAVCIGGDGDLMMSPGALWTAAHERLPILYVVHNNHAWFQEVMYVQRMANKRNRGLDRIHIGTFMNDPDINIAGLAKNMGVYSEGPVIDPKDLGPAYRRALEVVKRGEPALVDVWSQGR